MKRALLQFPIAGLHLLHLRLLFWHFEMKTTRINDYLIKVLLNANQTKVNSATFAVEMFAVKETVQSSSTILSSLQYCLQSNPTLLVSNVFHWNSFTVWGWNYPPWVWSCAAQHLLKLPKRVIFAIFRTLRPYQFCPIPTTNCMNSLLENWAKKF